jgi:transposase
MVQGSNPCAGTKSELNFPLIGLVTLMAYSCQRRCETPQIAPVSNSPPEPGCARFLLKQFTLQQEVSRDGRPRRVHGHSRAWVKGKSVSEIARATGRDRKTIRRLLQGKAPAERKPRQVASKLDRFREYLLSRMLGDDPVSNAEVLFDEIREQGYEGGRSILKEFMAPFREVAKNKTTERFETRPGQQGQVDWGTFKKPGRKRVQGFVMTLGWSRTMYLDFTDTQALAFFLACHERAFHYYGGVPEEIFYDRTKTVWLRDDDRGEPVFHPGLLDFASHYGYRPRLCHAYRPQTNGVAS